MKIGILWQQKDLLQVSPLCLIVKRGILWQKKDELIPGKSSLFVNEERNPLAEEGQTFFWSAVFVYQCRMEFPEPILLK
jgi:hypothetical protein